MHAAHRQKVSSGRSEKYYALNGAANFLFFEMGHYVCMWGCLLKTLVCCQASPPFPKLGEGNISCLQIHYDRLDTANLSFHVKTCQWHLTGRESMSDLKCFQKKKKKKTPADMWMKTLDALKRICTEYKEFNYIHRPMMLCFELIWYTVCFYLFYAAIILKLP